MATRCRLVYGWTNHMDRWEFQKSFIRWYDGYPEAIIPLLMEHKADIGNMNNAVDDVSHEFCELESFENGVTPDYIYYVDMSDTANIRCTVLGGDLEFYNKYGITNYKVIKEFTL